jgi:thiol-disulfide isomerase/thioredoxin
MRSPSLASCIGVALLFLLLVGCAPNEEPEPEVENTPPPSCLADNNWPKSNAPSDYEGTGIREGAFALDFTAEDQFGNEVALTQFYGSFMLLDFSAVWCPPCQQAAEGAPGVFHEGNEMSRNFEFWYVHVLVDDAEWGADETGGWATVGDAADWANDYGLEFPVLAGEGAFWAGQDYEITSLPTILVIDPNMQIVRSWTGFPGDGTLVYGVRTAYLDFIDANPDWESTICDERPE